MDRASDSGSEGWGFESLPAYQKNRYPFRDNGFSNMLVGLERAAPVGTLVQKRAGGTFLDNMK